MDDREIMEILIVDDDPGDVALFQDMCANAGYVALIVAHGMDTVAAARELMPDLILLNVMMPGLDAFQTTESLKNDEKTAHIPIILLTDIHSIEDIHKGLSAGADDFVRRPVDSRITLLRIRNHLKIKKYQDLLEMHNQVLDEEVMHKVEELVWSFEELEKSNQHTKAAFLDTIHRLILASEYKDEDTGRHIKRLGLYSEVLASSLGMDMDFTNRIFHAAPMHDIGKVAIPDKIILSPHKLSPEEAALVQTHTTVGGDILKGAKSPYLQMGELIARCHHERWDGTGYPQGLKGEAIPLAARITSMADQYDALRSKRPYKQTFDHGTAVKIISCGDGRTMPGHFDPKILEVFIKQQGKFQEIYETLEDDESS